MAPIRANGRREQTAPNRPPRALLPIMRIRNLSFILLALIGIACQPAGESSPIAQRQEQPATIDIVYVTPTSVPTRVPTAVLIPPTAFPTPTEYVDSASKPDTIPETTVDCHADLEALYTSAGDLCLSGPSGFFCNGGLPPEVNPAGDLLHTRGALAEARVLDSVRAVPGAGGLLWLRLEENIQMDALMIGPMSIKNVVPANSNSAKWQSLTIESDPVETLCESAPAAGVLVVQGLYGQTSRVVINGVSTEINGTVIALTQDDLTKFIAIEGQIQLIALGQSFAINAGEQLNVSYQGDNWQKPAEAPAQRTLLDYELIKNLPIVLFDRPVPIPQPGFVQTQGGVNMRIAPDIEARLLFQVPAGETMSVLGISTDREWLHIRLGNGETGWMSAELLAQNLGEITQVYDLTPAPPQRYGELASRAFVDVAAGGNLREAPDTAFRIIRTLPYGTQLRLLARSPYSPWVKVDTGTETGWIALFLLRTESVIGSLPIDYNVPLPQRATPTPSFSFGGGHAYPDPESGS